MAAPSRVEVHIDQALTAFSVGYRNLDMVARDVLPVVTVQFQTGNYFVFDQSDWFRDEAERVGWGAESPILEWKMDAVGSYTCIEWGAAVVVPDQLVQNSDAPLRPRLTATRLAVTKLELALERRVAAQLNSSSVFSGFTSTPGTLWDVLATSDPFGDVMVGMNSIALNAGVQGNSMLINQDVLHVLLRHPDVLTRLQYVLAADQMAIRNRLAAQFGLQNLYIGRAIYDSALEGASASYAVVWADDALIFYKEPTPAIESPSLGYTLELANSRKVSRFRLDTRYSDQIDARESTDEIVVFAAAGYMHDQVIT